MKKYLLRKVREFFQVEPVTGIEEETLQFILGACEDSHPKEFMGLLSAEITGMGRVITNVNLVPAAKRSETSVFYSREHIPNSTNIVGSVHSHPNGVVQPSEADMNSFVAGTTHIIVGAPYTEDSWKAFDKNGAAKDLEVYPSEFF